MTARVEKWGAAVGKILFEKLKRSNKNIIPQELFEYFKNTKIVLSLQNYQYVIIFKSCFVFD
jgi:hypothetical protein